MIGALLLLVGLLGLCLLGSGVIVLWDAWRPARAPKDHRPSYEIAGLGIVIGIGLTSWLQLLASQVGIPLGRTLSVSLAGLGICVGIFAWSRRAIVSPAVTPSNSALVRFCQVLIGLLFLNLLIQTLLTPQHLWDERAIYAIKAAVLSEDQSIASPALRNPDFVQYHPRYPLLIPLAEQHIGALLGAVNDRWSKILFPLMSLGLWLSFAGVLTRHCGRRAAWVFALLLASVPVLTFWEYGFLCGQADAPTACLHGITVLLIWDWLRSSRRTPQGVLSTAHGLALPGLCAGLSLFVKDEAMAYFLVDTALLVAILGGGGLRDCRASVACGVAYLAAASMIALPWFLHRRLLPVTGEMTYFDRLSLTSLAAGAGAFWWSLGHLPQRMFREAGEWGLQWWGMCLAAVTAPRQALKASQLFLLGDILGALAGLVIAGMIAPTPVEEHIGGSSHRFLMQLAPVAVLLIAGQWFADAE
jgi:hypothetical protein